MGRKILSSDFYTLQKENGVAKISIHSFPTLYKYQPVSEYSLHNFEYDEIWGTVPAAFNDPYDSSVCYSENKVNKFIKENLTEQRIENYKLFPQTTKKSDIAEFITRNLIDCDNYRKQYCVACFSIYNDSEIMWAHYADSAKGFCLAYDSQALMNAAAACSQKIANRIRESSSLDVDFSEFDNQPSIMPVIYNGTKINITDKIINVLPLFFEYLDKLSCGVSQTEACCETVLDNLNVIREQLKENRFVTPTMLCSKNKEWRYEQEWRIFTHNENLYFGNPKDSHMAIGNIVAKAVYLGERMHEYSRRMIIAMAKEKNIPVYQMRSKMYKNNYRLNPILL